MNKKRFFIVFFIANVLYICINFIGKANFLGPFTYIAMVGPFTELNYKNTTGGAAYFRGGITGAKYLAIGFLYLFLRHIMNTYFGVSLPV